MVTEQYEHCKTQILRDTNFYEREDKYQNQKFMFKLNTYLPTSKEPNEKKECDYLTYVDCETNIYTKEKN